MNSHETDSDAPDEILAEVRRIKEELAAAHGYDVRKMLEEARRDQAQSGRRMIPAPQQRIETTFQQATGLVLEKNAELYQRLS